jgi:hypothetical protein
MKPLDPDKLSAMLAKLPTEKKAETA